MTVEELIAKLAALPQDWQISGTKNGSLEFWEPGQKAVGQKYGYMFTDGRENIEYVRKHVQRERF